VVGATTDRVSGARVLCVTSSGSSLNPDFGCTKS
jgi:hypothetical protein